MPVLKVAGELRLVAAAGHSLTGNILNVYLGIFAVWQVWELMEKVTQIRVKYSSEISPRSSGKVSVPCSPDDVCCIQVFDEAPRLELSRIQVKPM